jgi:hypothetical protein
LHRNGSTVESEKRKVENNLRVIARKAQTFEGYPELAQPGWFNLADFMDKRYKAQFANLE